VFFLRDYRVGESRLLASATARRLVSWTLAACWEGPAVSAGKLGVVRLPWSAIVGASPAAGGGGDPGDSAADQAKAPPSAAAPLPPCPLESDGGPPGDPLLCRSCRSSPRDLGGLRAGGEVPCSRCRWRSTRRSRRDRAGDALYPGANSLTVQDTVRRRSRSR